MSTLETQVPERGTRVPEVSGRQGLRRLVPYVLKHKVKFFAGLALVPFFVACQLAIPKQLASAVGMLVDTNPEHPLDAGIWAEKLLILVALGTTYATLRFISRILIMGISRRVEEDLKSDLFHHLTRMPLDFHDRARIGDLISRSNQDVELLRFQAGPTLFFGASVLFLFPTTLYFLFRLSPELGFSVLVLFGIGISFMLRVFGVIQKRSRAVQDALGEIGAKAQEDFTGIRVLQAFAREGAEVDAFAEVANHGMSMQVQLAKTRGQLDAIFFGAGSFGLLAVISVGVYSGLGVTQLFEAFIYLQMLVWPLLILGWVMQTYNRSAAAIERIDEIFEIPVEDGGGTTRLAGDDGAARRAPSLEARNLDFEYIGPPPIKDKEKEEEDGARKSDATSPTLAELKALPMGPRALHGINFRLEANQTLGLVGPVGAGKSSLISLFTRLYDPPKRSLFVDGIDVWDLPLQDLRSLFSVAPQEPFLFGESIKSNILFAHGEAAAGAGGTEDTDELVATVLESSRLAPDLETMPGGLEQVVGERGLTLSGGQKQRTSLARALAGRRPVLVLDDTLSAVDHATEKHILEALRELRGRQTTIIIAHRLEAVREADLILVLDEGHVIEQGSHEELLKSSGWYAQTWKQQQQERAG